MSEKAKEAFIILIPPLKQLQTAMRKIEAA